MANAYLTGRGEVISVLRAQIELVEDKELPMARQKQALCKAHEWGWLESYFAGYANRLELELEQMKICIDRQIDAAARKE